MKIRKLFKYEMAHIVRGAWTRRCRENMHGHSYEVEIIFAGTRVDEGNMLLDFGIIKSFIGGLIDSFDHASMLENLENDEEIVDLFLRKFERVIVSPYASTAEEQAKLFHTLVSQLLHNYLAENGISGVMLESVTVHETKTGYATTDEGLVRDGVREIPVIMLIDKTPGELDNDREYLSQLIKDRHVTYFSKRIVEEWSDTLKKYMSQL